jgi:sugar phosphate isomerase/epimerase
MRTDQIALQLYTVREAMAADPERAVGMVAALGYRAVELAGLGDWPARQARATFDAEGIEVVAAHVGLDALREGLEARLDELDAIGCRRVIVPWLGAESRASAEGIRGAVDALAGLAGTCRRRGFSFGYHNHDFEFAQIEGTSLWAELRRRLPAWAELEIDVYWAAYAGEDPVGLIGDEAGRTRLLHMKDLGPDRQDRPPGDGRLPWPEIVEAGRRAGVAWYVVEQDHPDDAFVAAARGLAFLRGLASAAPG